MALADPPALRRAAAADSAELAAAGAITMSGALHKKGWRRKGWKLRFFELRGASLRYFAEEGSVSAKGEVEVVGVTVIPECGGFKRSHRFDVMCADASRTLCLAAASADDVALWVQRLEGVAAAVPLALHPRLTAFRKTAPGVMSSALFKEQQGAASAAAEERRATEAAAAEERRAADAKADAKKKQRQHSATDR